jgi:polysaccharide biosynthesis transport protein
MPSDEATPELDLWSYVRILGRRKWWIIIMTVVGLVAGAAYVYVSPKKYSATSLLQVEPTTGNLSVSGPTPTVAPTTVSTQLQLLTSSAVVNVVAASLKFTPSITAAQVGSTNVLSVTATDTSPAKAALIANTYAKDFVNYERQTALTSLAAEELQYQQQITADSTQLAKETVASTGYTALSDREALLQQDLQQLEIDGASSGGVQVASTAPVPTKLSSPKKLTDLGIGGVAGLVLGFLLAGLIELLDDKVYDQADLERLAPGVPVLGQIPLIGSWKDKKSALLVSLTEPSSIVTEAYRSLRTSLQFASYDDPVQTVLVTSPTATDGKTSTVANLGVMFAMAGQNVVIVSSDLRRPRLGQFFGINEQIGLTSVVIGDATLDQALQPVEGVPGMTLLGSGPIPPNPSELLGSKKMAELIVQLREKFDVIVIDSPPLLPVTDPVILARLADLTLLIVGAGQTKKGQLSRAFQQVEQSGAPRLGIVFNEVRRESDKSYNYSYSYAYKPNQNGSSATATPSRMEPAAPDKNGPAHARMPIDIDDKALD